MTLLTFYPSSLFLADLNPSSGTGEVAGQEGGSQHKSPSEGCPGLFFSDSRSPSASKLTSG